MESEDGLQQLVPSSMCGLRSTCLCSLSYLSGSALGMLLLLLFVFERSKHFFHRLTMHPFRLGMAGAQWQV